MRHWIVQSALTLLGTALIGCGAVAPTTPPPPAVDPTIPFDTTQKVDVEVAARVMGEPVVGATVNVYQGFNADDTVNVDTKVLAGITDQTGVFHTQVVLPADLKAVGVRVDYIGVISEPIRLEIKNKTAQLLLDNETVTQLDVKVPQSQRIVPTSIRAQAVPYNYKYLNGFGGWNSLGVPSNLVSNSSKVNAEMLRTINASVPEYSSVPNHPTHSRFIARGSVSNLVLSQSADVWLTFVHEGAGYKNAVGYYTYDANNPPSSVNEVLGTMTLAYPNASYNGSGGGLQSGNRVKLRYYDTATQTWSETFPAGTGVGWFLVSNGWRDSATGVAERSFEQTVFSDPVLNYQTYKGQGMSVEQSAQTVLLMDQGHQTLLLGFEDILRHHGGDQDFNDAVLLVETSNFAAIQTSNIVVRDPVDPSVTHTSSMKPVDDPAAQDRDHDGVNDTFDDYPDDPTRAFNTYYPAKTDFGTLAFEDLWPKLGDYDFNDAVVDYNIVQVANASNKLVEIDAEFILKALGGGYHSGFGFSTDLSPDQIKQVSYTWERDGVAQAGNPPIHYTTSRLANGLEAGQTKAVVVVFDDGYDILTPSLVNRPYYSNVVPGEPYKTPGKVKVKIELNQPLAMSAPGTAPYNPFLIPNGKAWGRSNEIHLAGYAPTALANTSRFGHDQDTSNAATGRYYIDTNGSPWAMHLPTQLSYIKEVLDQPGGSVSLGVDIRNGYLKFDSWLSSGGANYKDWYRDVPTYRAPSNIYTATP